MTATEKYKRAEALFNDRTKRELADMVVHREGDLEDALHREADLEDAKAESEHMRLKALAVAGELQEESERLSAENAKLRELVRDMYGFIERMDEECGDVTFSDCFDYCKHDATDDGCCKTGECWYEQRMRDLGVEVDE